MHHYTVYSDDLQEGIWFLELNPSRLHDADLKVIPSNQRQQQAEGLADCLKYDRPDIILKDEDDIIFILERTVEVPSGHNVGQRFGRLVAAAEMRIPYVYFFPYAAYKHGGKTSGPRWANLRLFYSIDKIEKVLDTAITTICWPVDDDYEVVRGGEQDKEVKEYLNMFFELYETYGLIGLEDRIIKSDFQQRQLRERERFIEKEITNPNQYDMPPESVTVYSVIDFENTFKVDTELEGDIKKIFLYHIGMKNIRSDPYTGMAALYRYLYCNDGGAELVLHFSEIEHEKWNSLRKTGKVYRMYKTFSYAILFSDEFIRSENL